jgi:ornithine decarboxylase
VIAGPTCDSVDTLYEKAGYKLPDALKAGDRVRLLSAGAYTTTYASVGFNGFPPPQEHYI